MKGYRIEEDTLGPVKIPQEALWGPQTERSRQNFPTGTKMPLAIIKILLQIKKATARANCKKQLLDPTKADLIGDAVDQLLNLNDEQLRQYFPLVVYQTGSGTQTNMSVNEVVAHVAQRINPNITILANDDVNQGQSSNDLFPTAMNISAALELQKLMQVLQHLIAELQPKQKQY